MSSSITPPVAGEEAAGLSSFLLPAAQLARLQPVWTKFLTLFAKTLSDKLDATVTAGARSIDTMAMPALLESFESVGSFFHLTTRPVAAEALAGLSYGLVARLLGALLGGTPAAPDERKALTDVERYILGGALDNLAVDLSAAWESAGIAFNYRPQVEENPGSSGGGAVLVFSAEFDLEGAVEKLVIAVPGFLSRLAADKPDGVGVRSGNAPSAVQQTIVSALSRAAVQVDAALPSCSFPMRELLALEPGHVLLLAMPVDSPLELKVAGVPKFRGEWVRQGDRHALLVH